MLYNLGIAQGAQPMTEDGKEPKAEAGLPVAGAEILSAELAQRLAEAGGFRRQWRRLMAALPLLIAGGVGLAMVRPEWTAIVHLNVGGWAEDGESRLTLAGWMLTVGAFVAAVGLYGPWLAGRVVAAGASYLLGISLALYLLLSTLVIFIDGEFSLGAIALAIVGLSLLWPGAAMKFGVGEVTRAELTAALAGEQDIGDRPGGWQRWVGRLLLALPMLGSGVAVLLWLGSARGRRGTRCVCLGAQAFLAWLTASIAAQVAGMTWQGSLMGMHYPGGGAEPVNLDAAVLKPALWVLAAWCGLSAALAVWAVGRELRGILVRRTLATGKPNGM